MPIAHVARGVLFITLTYPRDWPGDWHEWKHQLDTWTKRLRRRLPAAAAVWKLEPQTRGAPHFHLLLVGVSYLAKDWLSRSWYEVVASNDPKHLAAGTQVQLAHSHRGVLAYAAKYTAKGQELPVDWQDGVGRWWGVVNRSGLGIVWLQAPMSEGMYWAVVRIVRKLIANRQHTRSRGPPRRMSSGGWLVLNDRTAKALWECALAGASERWTQDFS